MVRSLVLPPRHAGEEEEEEEEKEKSAEVFLTSLLFPPSEIWTFSNEPVFWIMFGVFVLPEGVLGDDFSAMLGSIVYLNFASVCGFVFWRNAWFDSGYNWCVSLRSYFSAMLASTVDTHFPGVRLRITAQCLVRQWIHILLVCGFVSQHSAWFDSGYIFCGSLRRRFGTLTSSKRCRACVVSSL